MMKSLKQLLFVAALIVGISISASAQKDGKDKPPPKETPPVIVVKPEPKKPKEEKPKDGDKKPQFMMYKSKVRYEG